MKGKALKIAYQLQFDEIENFEFDLGWLQPRPHKELPLGRYSYIVYNDSIEKFLAERFGRDGLCLKIFRGKLALDEANPLRTFRWARVHLPDATRIQNLIALEGRAPRVLAIVLVNSKWIAQVVEFVAAQHHNSRQEIIESLQPEMEILLEKYGIRQIMGSGTGDFGTLNFRAGKCLDFGNYRFRDREKYKLSLIERICGEGATKCMQYQGIPELGIGGWRGTKRRIQQMELDKIDFKGKTVLDLCCNVGAFSREAFDRGAKRVVGVDRGRAKVAAEISNWLGYWNLDFLKLKLPQQVQEIKALSSLSSFDIVFAFSTAGHVRGYAKWIADFTDEVLLLEGHQKDTKETYWDQLKKDFGQVTYLGKTTDQGPRPIFRCLP